MSKKNKILFFDIETSAILATIWAVGKQYISHNHLLNEEVNGKIHNKTDIICIGYCWNDNQPARTLGWGYDARDSKPMLEKFAELVSQADIVVGKNIIDFDIKHINTLMLMYKLPSIKYPKVLDLGVSIKKNFKFQSYSLDYVCNTLKIGSKSKVTFSDWINTMLRTKESSYKKLLSYCANDVEITRKLFDELNEHKIVTSCKQCDSINVKKNGTMVDSSGVTYQNYYCNTHHGYAGKIKLIESTKLEA